MSGVHASVQQQPPPPQQQQQQQQPPAGPKYAEWILDTIDQLRKRKARPDLDRICHMLERRYGVSPVQTQTELDRLVDAETVMKVDYKGNTSYRNAAKWGRRSSLSGQVLNSTDVSRLLVRTVRELEAAREQTLAHQDGDDDDRRSTTSSSSAAAAAALAGGGSSVGVGIGAIERYLLQQNSETTLIRTRLQVALERETVATSLLKLPNGNYTAFDKLDSPPPQQQRQPPPQQPAKAPPPQQQQQQQQHPPPAARATAAPPAKSAVKAESGVAKGAVAAAIPAPKALKGLKGRLKGVKEKRKLTPSGARADGKTLVPPLPVPPKKGRPPNKRRRFKKTHGPDFVENYDSSFEEPEPKCDYCLLTAACNCNGRPEDLLFCKDCNAKAHPSCMDYSMDLAMRSRMSPWQCMDCKTCWVCDDSGDADCMLFCDSCDKGYHMGCHIPKVTGKPSGKWVCCQCTGDGKKTQAPPPPLVVKTDVDFSDPNEPGQIANQTIDGTPGLPTPCESPVPEAEQNRKTFNYFFSASVLNDNKENNEVIPDASNWSIEDVEDYFKGAGFTEQASAFKEQEIDGKSLLLLKRSDVLTGLSIKLGPALKIYNHVKRLQTRRADGHLIY